MARRLSGIVLALVLIGSAFASAASGARLYVPGSGTGPPEEIGAFDLGVDGSLAPLAGSPFPGVGVTGEGLRRLVFTPGGDRAATGFFNNGGVQGYTVSPAGIFSLAGLAPVTASVTSVAITPDGRYAFAATREFGGRAAEGIHRFAVGADGTLASLGAPTPLASDSYDLAVSPDGRFLFALDGGYVQGFALGADGSLAPLGKTGQIGAAMLSTASDGRYLYVYTETSEPGLAVYAIGADGSLAQRGTPVTLPPGSSGRSFAVAPDGRHAFIIDTNADQVVTAAIAEDGSPALLPGGLPVNEPEMLVVSPEGRYLSYYHEEGVDFVVDVAAIGADGSLAKLPSRVFFGDGEGARLSFQPQPTPVARFISQVAAPGEATRFDATGSTGAARYDWDFGDGTKLADGGPRPAHAYAAPGAYEVTLSVLDLNGCGARHYYDGQSTVCPGGATTEAKGSVDTLPALGNLKAKPKKFKPKPKGRAKGRFGTTFRYRLTEAASVRFTIEKKLKKKKGRPARFKRVGFLAKKGKAGANRLKWNGRLKGKPLAAGSYRATVVATDSAGGRSAAKKIGFRVLPLP